MVKAIKTKLSTRREIKIVAGQREDEAVISIPEVVGVAIVSVQPPLVIVVLHIEEVQVAVGIGNVWQAVSATIR